MEKTLDKDLTKPRDKRSILIESTVRSIFGLLFLAAILFLSSGRLDWGMAWVYLGFSAISMAGTLAYFLAHDPDLLAERLKGLKGAKSWDKLLAPLVAVVLPLALLLVAGFDKRYGWSLVLPISIELIAFAVLIVGYAVFLWAMAVNTFFAATVRIQTERGQKVITTGPYGFVRHPGYAGASLVNLGLAIMLGSLWALIPATLVVIVLIVRTAFEDETLKQELDGYRDYANRVPYRLVPYLW